jgi:polyvinyl alcohol dehydrogenase (cytochrome)
MAVRKLRADPRGHAHRVATTMLGVATAMLLAAMPLVSAGANPTQELSSTANLPNPAGEQIFEAVCAACHEHARARAPDAYLLKRMTPSSIYRTLTTGAMRIQAQGLDQAQKRAVVEFLAGPLDASDAKLKPPPCHGPAADFNFSLPPPFAGWGLDPANTRYVNSRTAGVGAGDVAGLRLKWAFGVNGATRMGSQPTLAGGAIYIGGQDGGVYALERDSGCLRWQFQAAAEVRTGIVVSPWSSGDPTARPEVYFGDVIGNVYALDAISGKRVWQDHVEAHPSATLTAAPVLYGERLYVAVSSIEEAVPGKYPCCTFRGSIVAYDAKSGVRRWQSYLSPKPKFRGTNDSGAEVYAPAGVAVWNAPTIDAKRGVMYFGTGDGYSSPVSKLSDAIVAMRLDTGRIVWSYQATKHDAWNVGCMLKEKPNCPREDGPDYDFGTAAILASDTHGRARVFAGQKSGWVHAVDPLNGHLLWKTRVGRGGLMGGVYFGLATREDVLFVPVNDVPDGGKHDQAARPGLYALDVATGNVLWVAAIPADACRERGAQCAPGIAAPVTATDDLVITGAGDGAIRIFNARSGEKLWQYDTTVSVVTVGGGSAHGGSIGGGAGPLVQGGTLIVESGYGYAGRIPGNVMLVFEVR